MTIKLGTLDRWKQVPKGKVISFTGTKQRRVRLTVNIGLETALCITTEEGEIRLLAVVPAGMTTLEFSHHGNFSVWPEEETPLWYQTAEDEPTFVVSDGQSYTTITDRPARNFELERVMFMQEQNMRKREARLMAEFEQRLKAAERKPDGEEAGIHGRKATQREKPLEKEGVHAPRAKGDNGPGKRDARPPGDGKPTPAGDGDNGSAEGNLE